MEPLRILVVGLGLIGRQRAEAVAELAQTTLAGTVDPVVEGADYDALEDVPPDTYDAAVIAVPHDLAAGAVTAVLGLGKPVLVEKPLGVNAAEARELAAQAEAVELPSFVGYNYRFLPTLMELFRAHADGRLGTLRNIDFLLGHGGHPGSAEGWKLRPERAGGGVLLDPGVHLLDLLLRLDPEIECTQVDATRGFWGTGIEEDLVASFAHDQLIATVRVSHIRWVNTFRIEAMGEEGYAIVEGRGGNYGSQTVRIGRRWAWKDTGKAQRDTEEVHDFGPDNVSLRDELEAVAGRWLGDDPGDGPAPATIAEALAVAELCGSMYARLREGSASSPP
jgi:1,5-anhydro-D-fructose reductase (1,5-anhydro-D-mannitol-forming)